MARSQKSINTSEALQRFEVCNSKLKIAGILNKTEKKRVKEAASILTAVQRSEKQVKYKLFLHELHDIGPHLVPACAIALGQGRIASMNKANRKQLLYEIKIRQKEFDDPSLRALASDNGILCSAGTVC
jgi:hypothetical protein